MGYHILLAQPETFKISRDRAIYGGRFSEGGTKSAQMNAEVIASFSGIRANDFVFFYVKGEGIYGLWKVRGEPYYDRTPIWADPDPYPYRVSIEPVVRGFSKPVALSDILDLRDKGRIWTFDLGAITKKNHYPVTSDEGKEVIRLLLRNNPIKAHVPLASNPYAPRANSPLPLKLECDKRGCLAYEGYLNAWFMRCFAQGRLKDVVGEYEDTINYVPTSFNKVMDIFLTHVTQIDGVDILHNFTCIELKTGMVTEEDLNQIIMYENWLIRKLAQGDAQMVQSVLVGFEFENGVVGYRDKRREIEEKTVRLLRYRVDQPKQDIVLQEV